MKQQIIQKIGQQVIPNFKDERFLSASQKENIYKNWHRFIKSEFKKGNFTKAIYDHLHLHCGFIAHFNRNGFYEEYFVDPQDTISFMDLFERECPSSWKLFKDDLTSVMMQELEKNKKTILKKLHATNLIVSKMEFEIAKKNLDKAQSLAGKNEEVDKNLYTFSHEDCDTALCMATKKDAQNSKCTKCNKPFFEGSN